MKSKAIVLLLLFSCVPLAQPGLHILSSDNTSFIFEYTPVITDSILITINSENYLKINISEGSKNNPGNGVPSLPVFVLPLGVPSETGNTIELLNSSFVEFDGKLAPYPTLTKEQGIVIEKYELSNEYYSFNSFFSDLVSFGDYGLVRNIPVQNIVIQPIQFNAMQSKIRIYKTITCKISFAVNRLKPVTETDPMLTDVIINYRTAAAWKIEEKRLSKGSFNSVLSTGKWFRFETPEEGIYKITKTMLAAFGIDASTVDPKTIKIYNNGGKVLPENVNTAAPGDLIENAVYIAGEGDGIFNDNDYILFYGRGVNFWEYDTLSRKHVRRFNPYSKSNFFWITSGGVFGKRTTEKPNLQGTANFIATTTPAFTHWDEDKINTLKSGRYFFGDEFTPNIKTRMYSNNLDNILPGSHIKCSFKFINGDAYARNLRIENNSAIIFDEIIEGRGLSSDAVFYSGIITQGSGSFTTSIPNNNLVITFDAQGNNSIGYLDYYELNYIKNLIPTGDVLLFYSPDTLETVEYHLSGFSNSNISIFDVTDFANIKMVTNPLISAGELRFISNEIKNKVSKYLAVGNSNFKNPLNPVEISNSNIHGEQAGARLIIITPKEFLNEAQRLKIHHETDSPVITSTFVAQTDQVFNEFSCGMCDVSGLRNFIKYAFDNWAIKPDQVLLFGDATYDYKNIEGHGDNFVITYETENSTNLLESYPMDDYFVNVSGKDNFIDLAIGRISAASSSDAKASVDKIIFYETKSEKGDWQNTISLVADDNVLTGGTETNTHTPQSETLADSLPGFFIKNKIYFADYPTVITGFGRKKPGVTEAIINSVNKGTLLLNYIGHGSPEQWAHEKVFEKSSIIPQFRNDKYFFLTAATCEFGYYDMPSSQSGTEALLLKPDGGSIGGFAASRPVQGDQNAEINECFYKNLLRSPRDTMNFPVTVGEAYLKTKMYRNSTNDNNFHLFGDPAVRLLIPQYYSFIDSINGVQISGSPIQLKALSNATVSGHISKDSQCWNDYNGEGILSIYDSERNVPLFSLQNNYYVKFDGGMLFKGRVSITNGRFSSSFTVPKDISYENKNGKVIFYYNNSGYSGIGYTKNIKIGGTDSSSVNDNTGPEIDVYFDNATNKNAYLVTPESNLMIHLSDDTGLNTTGTGIGHRLEGIINDNIKDPIDFTSYFTGDLDAGGKSGTVNYKINTFNEGKYKLNVKAWDVFNNFSNETIYFEIVSGNELQVKNVLNYPNPFSGSTTFTLQQNLSTSLDVTIKIYTVSGRLIKNIFSPSMQDRFVKINWDGMDEDGNPIANGTYFYKIVLRSIDGLYNKSVLGKLAVLK